MRRLSALLLVIALMASGCSTRDTVDDRLWHDQHPALSATLHGSVFVIDLIVNAALQTAALALCGR